MAKRKLFIDNYTFDTANGTITIKEKIFPEKFLLITDVTINKVIYNFGDPNFGYNSITHDDNEYTIINLVADVVALGAQDTDHLQIFIDHDHQEVEFSESFIDPVSKIRVSNPENLIDTDFEYGLQNSKWETLELLNNVPSFYSTGQSIIGLQKVSSINGSDVIRVDFNQPHGLSKGSPIDVNGLDSNTAEGKYLVSSIVDDFSFTYKARKLQSRVATISGPYTTIIPGEFYTGSRVAYAEENGMTTDTLTPSTITITTPYEHGFKAGSSFYLLNTVSPRTLVLDDVTTSNAPDGEPYVDPQDTVSDTQSVNGSLTETKQLVGAYSKKILAADVDVANDRILWEGHEFREDDCVLYIKPAGDTSIGGLSSFDVYYITNPTTDDFQLKATFNGSPITITSAGTYNFGRGQFMIAYEISNADSVYRRYNEYWRTPGHRFGSGSGWDLRANGYGKMRSRPDFLPLFFKGTNTAWYGTSSYDVVWNKPYYSPRYDADMTIPDNGASPNTFNFIEDITRYTGQDTFRANNVSFATTYLYRNLSYYWSNGTYNFGRGEMFFIPLNYDTERDTFYIQDHGLEDGQSIAWATTSGNTPTRSTTVVNNYTSVYNPVNITDSSVDTIEIVSNDRFRIKSGSTAYRVHDASGVYDLTAIVEKQTKNSFYIENHGLSNDSRLKIDVEALGVLPTAETGDITYTASDSDVETLYQIINSGIEDFIAESETATSQTYTDMYMNGPNARQIFNTGMETSSTINYAYLEGYVSSQYGAYSLNNATNFSNMFTGNVEDLGTGLGMQGRGFKIIGESYVVDKTIPYFSTLIIGPENIAHDTRMYFVVNSNYASGILNQFAGTVNPAVYTTEGAVTTDIRYARTAQYFQTTGRDSFLFYNIVLRKNAWDSGTFNKPVSTRGTNNHYTFLYGSMTDYVNVVVALRVPDAINIDSTYIGNLDTRILERLASDYSYPSLDLLGEYNVDVISNNRFRLKNDIGTELNLTNSGTETIIFQDVGNQYGTADGVYAVTDVPNETTMTFELPFRADSKRVGIVVDDQTVTDHFYFPSYHNLANYTPIIYSNNGNADLPGLVDNTTYYAFVEDPNYIRIAASPDDILVNSFILIDWASVTSGEIHVFSSESVNGLIPVPEDISVTENSKTIIGDTGSIFKTYYKSGDKILIVNDGTTPGRLEEFTVSTVVDDVEMVLTEAPSFTSAATKLMVPTALYVRPDGATLHRPFDGGVEINAGTSPYSQIVRQTRKYFRYQSGKGIQVSLAINFNPPILVEDIFSNGTTVTVRTKYPHGLTTNNSVTIRDSLDTEYNGDYVVDTVQDEFVFTYELLSIPTTSIPRGLISFNINGWTGSAVRAGMFDFQNGFFYEYDGSQIYAVRRSSTQQVSGTGTVINNSNLLLGNGTNFSGQLSQGETIVIRGQTYKVTKIKSRTEAVIQPAYKGVSANGVVLTKTVDTKIPQSEWNLDRCDGNGPSGFDLDVTKIQMAYMDYSWYGAGKIRFGFKDRKGHVKYVHEFVHNNKLTEAYMRSGNIPARYEIENTDTATYVPNLFHWGTSVIMDGTFNDDKAYLFTAASNNLSFTNGQGLSATTNANSVLDRQWNRDKRSYDWYVRLSFASSDASKFTTGTSLYTVNEQLNGQVVDSATYSGSSYRVYIYLTTQFNTPSNYPVVASGTAVSIGQPASGGDGTDLSKSTIPLISIRLAPSVDNGITGNLGEREIINRMQLKLNEVGMVLSHDSEVALILNGNLSNIGFSNVQDPSLSNLITHQQGDVVIGGTEIFSFRASGGTEDSTGRRLSAASNFDLREITDMGNSILGGDGVFPNGPDLLTVAVRVSDTSDISANSPYNASARITWSESQA